MRFRTELNETNPAPPFSRAGASGFVLKDIPPDQLVVAVRTVADGGALLAPSVTRRLIGQFASQAAVDAGLATRLRELTARERDVVVAVARGCSNAEIAGELFIGPATVKSHVSSVLTKLGLRDRAQIVVTAYEGGLVTPGELGGVPRRDAATHTAGQPAPTGQMSRSCSPSDSTADGLYLATTFLRSAFPLRPWKRRATFGARSR